MSHKNSHIASYRAQETPQRRVHQIQLKRDETYSLKDYFKQYSQFEKTGGHNIVVEYGLNPAAYDKMQMLHITSTGGKNNLALNNLLDVTLILNGAHVGIENPSEGIGILERLAGAGYDLMRGECDKYIAAKGIEKWKAFRKNSKIFKQ